jgi:TonB family protein
MRGMGFKIILATILSTVLHFFILTLLDTIPLISKEIPPQPNLYMVDLVPLPREQPASQKEEEPAVQQRVEEVKKEEVKKEEVKKEEVTREELKKEEVKKEEVKEVKQKEEVKKEEKTVAADAGTEKEKKEKAEKQPVDPDKQLSASIEEIKQKVAARENGDSLEPEMTAAEIQDYGNTVIERVKRSWAILNIWSEEELEAFIVIEVDEKGQVTSRFEKSSGSRVFDQAAMRAIRKAAPFDPPPGNKTLTFPPLRFSSR